MALQGDVRSLNLASVLQDLASNEKTGTLTLQQDERMLHLWMESGLIRLVGLGSQRGPSVVAGLLALGRIAPEDLPAAGSGTPAEEQKLLRRLAKAHGIAPEELTMGLQQQMTEHALETFLWSEARYDFLDGDPAVTSFDLGQLKLGARLAVDNLVMESLRRQDEWEDTKRAIALSGEVLVADESMLPADADPVQRRILAMLDGERTVRDILERTRLGPFTVYTAIAALRRCGAARPMSAAEALEHGREHCRRGQWEQGLRLALYGLEREPNNQDLRELSAVAHDGLGRPAEAIAEYRQLAAAQLEEGRPEAALETYRNVLSLSPGDLYANEKVFDLLLEVGRDDEALHSAEQFAQAAKRAGLPEKARDIYSRLIQAFGEDEGRIEAVADLQRELGDNREAADLYQRLLQMAMRRRDDDLALKRAEIILALDPSRADVVEVRDRLASGALERGRARRRKAKLLTMLAVLIGAVALVGGYEGMARWRMWKVRPQITEKMAAGEHRAALELYDSVEGSFPFSLVVREMQGEREKVEEMYITARLAVAEHLDGEKDLKGAIDATADAADFARRDDLVARVRKLADALDQKRSKLEGRWIDAIRGGILAKIRAGGEAGKQAAEELSGYRDPFAVPALRGLLNDPSPEVRGSAVNALAMIESHRALLGLVDALADPDAGIRTRAAAFLTTRTRQRFGEDRLEWHRYVIQKDPRRRQGVPLLQPAIDAVERLGQPAVEWRVYNLSKEPVEVVVINPVAGLRVVAPDGATRKVVLPQKSEPREARLGPGDFVGGTIELRQVCPTFAQSGAGGLYRLDWRADLRVDDSAQTGAAAALIVTAPEE